MTDFTRGDIVRVSLDLQGTVRGVDNCCQRDFVEVAVGFADGDPGAHPLNVPVEYVSRAEPEPVVGMIRRGAGGLNVAVWTGTGWETLHDFVSDPRYYDHWPIIYTPEKQA